MRPALEVLELNQGNTLIVPRAYLYRDGLPLQIDPGDTVTFTMVADPGSAVKVDDEPAVIVQAGTAGPPATPAELRYDWQPEDVDTPGRYYAWFTRAVGGKTEDFPIGPLYRIVIYGRVAPAP